MTSVPDSVLDLIASGRKIDAIKEVRALTGLGLRDAKETVEALERGEHVSIQIQQRPAQARGSLDPSDPNELAARVLALVEDGRTIQAVKEVREATGADLGDAKQLVDQIVQDVQPEAAPLQIVAPRQSSRIVVTVAFLIALIGVVLAYLMAA
ncbi:MAG: hypothetical protein Rubg2KO_24200 [Rubricoccaceae bacterium]